MAKSSGEIDREVDVMTAELEVEDARANLEAGLEAASTSGRKVLSKFKNQAKPIAIGVAIVGGVALLAGTFRLVRGAFARPRPPRRDLPFSRPSFSSQFIRAALTSAASALASAAARRAIRELEQMQDEAKPENPAIRYS